MNVRAKARRTVETIATRAARWVTVRMESNHLLLVSCGDRDRSTIRLEVRRPRGEARFYLDKQHRAIPREDINFHIRVSMQHTNTAQNLTPQTIYCILGTSVTQGIAAFRWVC